MFLCVYLFYVVLCIFDFFAYVICFCCCYCCCRSVCFFRLSVVSIISVWSFSCSLYLIVLIKRNKTTTTKILLQKSIFTLLAYLSQGYWMIYKFSDHDHPSHHHHHQNITNFVSRADAPLPRPTHSYCTHDPSHWFCVQSIPSPRTEWQSVVVGEVDGPIRRSNITVYNLAG